MSTSPVQLLSTFHQSPNHLWFTSCPSTVRVLRTYSLPHVYLLSTSYLHPFILYIFSAPPGLLLSKFCPSPICLLSSKDHLLSTSYLHTVQLLSISFLSPACLLFTLCLPPFYILSTFCLPPIYFWFISVHLMSTSCLPSVDFLSTFFTPCPYPIHLMTTFSPFPVCPLYICCPSPVHFLCTSF